MRRSRIMRVCEKTEKENGINQLGEQKVFKSGRIIVFKDTALLKREYS